MTASPCLSTGESSGHLDTYNSCEIPTNNTSSIYTTLLSHGQVVGHPDVDRLLEALRCVDQHSSSRCGLLCCPTDLMNHAAIAPVKCSDTVQLQLAKLQFLLSVAGQNVTAETHSVPTLFLSSPTSSSVNVQSSVCDTSMYQKVMCTVADELQHRKENVIPLCSSVDCVPKSSPNLLHQLLSGADIAQVRTRSGLIETNFCVSGTPELSTSDSSGCSHPTRVPANSVKGSTGVDAIDNNNYHYECPSSADSHTTSSLPSSPVDTSATGWAVADSSPNPPHNSTSVYQGNLAIPLILFTEKLLDLLKEVESASVVSSSLSSCGMKPSCLNSASPVPSSDGAAELNTDNVDAETSGNVFSHRLQQLLVPNPRSSTYSCNQDDASTKSQSPVPTILQSQSGANHPDCSSSDTMLYSAAPTIGVPRTDRVPSVQQPSQSRPRSYSDLHQGMCYRHKLHRAHRIRSPSRADKVVRPVRGFIETEKLTRELESSLFAQLVLSSEPPSSKQEAHSFPCKTDDTQAATSVVPTLCESRSTGSNFTLTCVTPPRERVFEWLREADLFIAEHCREIPLGTLLSAAISPARTNLIELCTDLFSSPSSETVPPSAKRVTSKMWHQFLLLSFCEHRCVPKASPQSLVTESPVEKWKDGFDCRQPVKQKLLNALHSLAALEVEDPPSVDTYLLEELADFVSTASSLNLSQDVYKALRFCILAQNAFPHHFSTNYTEALAELQAQLPDAGDPWMMIQVLKLLNRLHCFDSGSLKLLFSLSSDRIHALPGSAGSTSLTVPPSVCSSPHTHDTGIPLAFKRKAHPSTIANEEDSDSAREMSPVGMRSRAYTTNSYNKSARLSALSASGSLTTRNRSDTVGHRTELHRKSPVS